MKFATDENVLKTYNYASVGKISETLTVTDKRVIMTTEGKMPDGSAVHCTDEIMIDSIQKVTGGVASKRNGFLLFLTVVTALLAIVLFFLKTATASAETMGTPSSNVTSFIIPIFCLIFSVIFLIAYIFSKKTSFDLTLFCKGKTEVGLASLIGTWKPKKPRKKVKIKVEESVGIEIVEEIGALIIESR